MRKNDPIRSASGDFTSEDIERCTSATQLRRWRFTIEQDILSVQMQIDKWIDAPNVIDGWFTRAKCCLKLQEILHSKVEERIFVIENGL